MKALCQICLADYISKRNKPNSPFAPLCGHAICLECLETEMLGKPCYLRCGVVKKKEIRSILLKDIDSGLQNWKQLLDSKSHKLLQELNIALDKRALELNEEREILAKALQDYSAGMVLEKALNEVCIELTALEDQDAALYRQIIQETGKLCQLEEMVACSSRRTNGREGRSTMNS